MTITPINTHQLAAELKQRAHQLGFDLVGIADASPSKYRDYYRQWLDDGRAGTMDYLHKRLDERTNPSVYLPGAKTVICVAINYFTPLDPAPPGAGKVARYALGDDYHEVFKPKLHQLADWLRERAPEAQFKCAVDTAPVMEKELAARAGIGWIGKNTCILNEHIGSWLLLGEVLTTLELPPDNPALDRCGTCTRCIEACPTGAITEPYQLDAKKCISYLTIEHRTEIAPDLSPQIADWIYGCDICQDVCPWNRKAPVADLLEFHPRFPTGTLNVPEVLTWQDEHYRTQLRNSAIKRIKLPVLQRNAAIVAQNIARKSQ
jgi:epoxyqueuosine reductase